MKNKNYKVRDGISLLISMGLVIVIMLFSLIVGNVVVSSIRQSANVNRANEAYFAAEGALEQGLMENYKAGAGFTLPEYLPVNYTNGNAEGKYKIEGQVPEGLLVGNEYVIPTPGTGNVLKDCDPLHPVISGSYNYLYEDVNGNVLSGDSDAIEHPCNWNKFGVGETVSIPLYSTNADGSINNPGTDLSTLKVKIRTACKYGNTMCPGTDRYNLNGFQGDDFFRCELPFKQTGCGDTIIAWQISGENKKGNKVYTMLPYSIVDGNSGKRQSLNSEIYESHINDAKNGVSDIPGFTCDNFCVLYQARGGQDLKTGDIGGILDFLLNIGTFPRTGDEVINKPILKLSVIHSLNEEITYPAPGNTIPHLEYQITTNSSLTNPPADTSQTIKAEGFSGSFKQVLEVKQPQESGFLEYVVQQ